MSKSTSSPQYEAVLKRLTKLRKNAGLTQRELGERLNVPHTWVAKVETGERRIDIVEFGWFCEACGASAATEAKALFDNGSIPRRSPKSERRK